MPGWVKWALGLFLVLLVAGGGLYYWFLVESALPEGKFVIDMTEIRRLAASQPGQKPSEVRVEHVATFSFPAVAVVAGDGFGSVKLPVFSYELVYPDGDGIIDTALPNTGDSDTETDFDQAAYDRVSAALLPAKFIVITHEHIDHIGGLAAHPDLAKVLPHALLTRIQLENKKGMEPAKFSDAALDGYKPLVYTQYYAVAPGVVLIAAPGHTPGSQMVFVQTENGAEFLFIGDVAWHMRNIDLVRERARAVTQFFLNEDRTEVMLQLDALHKLHDAEPNLAIVPGHDGPVIDSLVKSGKLLQGFR